MEKAPPLEKITSWLKEKNPLAICTEGNFSVQDIDPKPWSGHFNYLISSGDNKFVFRFKGPEWGEASKGILDEYNTLKAIERYAVSPRVYYLTDDFFGEHALLEEYIAGDVFSGLSLDEQKKALPNVAQLIAQINLIPLSDRIPFQHELVTYDISKKTWRLRLEEIEKDPRTTSFGKEIKDVLPRAEKMLDNFTRALTLALRQFHPLFIFESAHAGHCVMTSSAPRFFNWEKVSYGDPSYTLAVFLSSYIHRGDFHEIKKLLVDAYVNILDVPNLDILLDMRLQEREISNVIWILWAHTQKKGELFTRMEEAHKRMERVKTILNNFSQ